MALKKDSEKNTHAVIKVEEVVTTGNGQQYLSCRAAGDFESPEALVDALKSAGVDASVDAPVSRGSSVSMAGLGEKYDRIFRKKPDPKNN